ncbi:hypothetical protein CcrC1_gp293 [Caulobacter phage C1]|nr:hypothetical protein CcrC1_gp293 [Caulobacter phage C1]UTU08522.1 hypothetical protein CcrC2_gp294 [Caulobacter phage C2]UTU09038.1 hypothetical protein CcrJ4_gp289 [Caulobacter phage J4]UTU10155.1 hypothetical protein CcrRB23_gp293 [Caulobacter phage RB23]WGN97189.1 hypothetical protein [Bertelyvirus sp.]
MSERYEVRFITPEGVPNPKGANTYSDAVFVRDSAAKMDPPYALANPDIVRFTETVIPPSAYPRMLEPLTGLEITEIRAALRRGCDERTAARALAQMGIFDR